MALDTHINAYVQEVEDKYKLVIKHLDDFKLAVDQLKSVYEQISAGDVSQAVSTVETDIKTDVKQVQEDTSSKKK